MGAVQSGKTASMLGVAALALDSGLDLLIVLGGTRLALWRQTYGRLLSQLDGSSRNSPQTVRDRVLLPQPDAVLDPNTDVELNQFYALNRAHARRTLAARRPIIIVAMKNVHHLRSLADVLHERVFPALDALARPVHMLVLDDEADDASVLDARIESGRDPSSYDLKQVPRAIVDLWETRPHGMATANDLLFVNYVAYTATPQANFLQADHNPLAPRHFVAALRTPFDLGALDRRETTYQEPLGYRAYYTGGEAFYRRLSEHPPCIANDTPSLVEALRSYAMASAVRLWADRTRLRPSDARARTYVSAAEAAQHAPTPNTMLIHPSASVADHFAAASTLIATASGLGEAMSRRLAEEGEGVLPAQGLAQDLERDPEAWQRWLEQFHSTADAVRVAFAAATAPPCPSLDDWPEVVQLLRDEVLPHLRFAVINSDPRADDRPRFEPERQADGTWRCPRDILTVFVAGNVMSRGLTLEGLSTTLFLRRADEPLADTQMQMQRWFGFRGPYLHTCRIFVTHEQERLFRQYHEVDEALRRAVIGLMDRTEVGSPNPIVLHGESYLATGKIAELRHVPICPGASPFVRVFNRGRDDPNARVVADLFRDEGSSDVVVDELTRGRLVDHTLSLLETADLLDCLTYAQHTPPTDDWEGERWRALEQHVGVDEQDAESPFFRPPSGGSERAPRTACPYSIAAYLRLWSACLTRRARGLFPTDDAELPWSMLDLHERQRLQPTFYVGLRYGAGEPVSDGPLADLDFAIRSMRRSASDGLLEATWGSRNPRGGDAYLGDALFDYHAHHLQAPISRPGGPAWRPVGAPGLILFHPVQQESGAAAIAVGAAIPLGGPDQFAATVPT